MSRRVCWIFWLNPRPDRLLFLLLGVGELQLLLDRFHLNRTRVSRRPGGTPNSQIRRSAPPGLAGAFAASRRDHAGRPSETGASLIVVLPWKLPVIGCRPLPILVLLSAIHQGGTGQRPRLVARHLLPVLVVLAPGPEGRDRLRVNRPPRSSGLLECGLARLEQPGEPVHDVEGHLAVIDAGDVHPELLVRADDLGGELGGLAHDDDPALAEG